MSENHPALHALDRALRHLRSSGQKWLGETQGYLANKAAEDPYAVVRLGLLLGAGASTLTASHLKTAGKKAIELVLMESLPVLVTGQPAKPSAQESLSS